MKRLKDDSEGVIVIGFVFIFFIVGMFAIFVVESSLLLSFKERNENIVRDVAHGVALNIDEDKAKQGIVDIDEVRGEEVKDTIIAHNYKSSVKNTMISNLKYINEGNNSVKVSFENEIDINNFGKHFIFFKNAKIKSTSSFIVYLEQDLAPLITSSEDKDKVEGENKGEGGINLDVMSLKEVLELFIIEEVF